MKYVYENGLIAFPSMATNFQYKSPLLLKAKLNMDGFDSLNLKTGDVVKINKAKSDLTLLHPTEHDFFDSCREKLGWSNNLLDKT